MPDSRSLNVSLKDLDDAKFRALDLVTERGYDSLRNVERNTRRGQAMLMSMKVGQAFAAGVLVRLRIGIKSLKKELAAMLGKATLLNWSTAATVPEARAREGAKQSDGTPAPALAKKPSAATISPLGLPGAALPGAAVVRPRGLSGAALPVPLFRCRASSAALPVPRFRCRGHKAAERSRRRARTTAVRPREGFRL